MVFHRCSLDKAKSKQQQTSMVLDEVAVCFAQKNAIMVATASVYRILTSGLCVALFFFLANPHFCYEHLFYVTLRKSIGIFALAIMFDLRRELIFCNFTAACEL